MVKQLQKYHNRSGRLGSYCFDKGGRRGILGSKSSKIPNMMLDKGKVKLALRLEGSEEESLVSSKPIVHFGFRRFGKVRYLKESHQLGKFISREDSGIHISLLHHEQLV